MSTKLSFFIALMMLKAILGNDKISDDNNRGKWSSWGPCSKTCGVGTKQRSFNCNNKNCRKDKNKGVKRRPCMVRPCEVTCPPQFKEVQWPRTKVGKTAVVPCPGGAVGNATRYCGIKTNSNSNKTKPTWEEVSTSNCELHASQLIKNKTNQIQWCIKMNTLNSSCRNKTQRLLDDLQKVSSEEMSSQDIDTVVTALDVITAFSRHKNSKTFMNKENSNKVINAASNLLELKNSKSWIKLQEDKNSNATERLVRIMETIGFLIANSSNSNSSVISTKNLILETKKIDPSTEFPVDGINFTYTQSSIFLPAELFDNNEPSVVVNIVYLTLGEILQLPVDHTDPRRNINSQKSEVNVSTTILSSTVKPRKTIKNKAFVKIALRNKRNVTKLNDSSSICVSWNPETPSGAWSDYGCQLVPGESDDEHTTCACSHLTLFSAFMDPHRIKLSRTHRFVLDFISYIGCIISLFSIAATMAVIICNWKKLKSQRTEVLLNICASIGIVCMLVLVEQPARQNEVLCKLIAVLLHYFLLTAFAWMLCKGILLYIVLVRIDTMSGRPGNRKTWYLLGWGFPLLLTIISLWATELKGYGNDSDLDICWLSVKNGVTWAFIAPALVVIVANLIVLTKIIIGLQKSKRIRNYSLKEQVKSGTRATAATMPLLGVTWLFGLLTFHTNLTVFKYLFTICNSLQGVFIFIFHCVFDRQVRRVLISVRRSKRQTQPQPPIRMKPYEPYVIKTERDPNQQYDKRRKACIDIAGIAGISS